MPAANLPETVTVPLAARLLGRSEKSVRRLLADALLPDHSTNTRAAIPLEAIEQRRGRQITPEEFLQADRDAERTRQAGYNRRRAGQ